MAKLAAIAILIFLFQSDFCRAMDDENVINEEESDVKLVGGDIKLTGAQQLELEFALKQQDGDIFGPQNAVISRADYNWPDGIIYYSLDSSLGDTARSAINAAMQEYMDETCITFMERTNQNDYINFFVGSGCWSYIGRVGGRQQLSIGNGCAFKGIVMHEIFHALGRWHEQSRPDRDQFVRINTDNIRADTLDNFEKLTSNLITTQGIPYDYGSVMHYNAYAFSINGNPTIEPLQNGVSLNDLGQRNGFSDSDKQHVLSLYCDNEVVSQWGSWQAWSTCTRACTSGTRTRTRTCVGGTNCQGSNIETETCNGQSSASWNAWSSWSGCTASCGTGRRSRSRVCSGAVSEIDTIFQNCNTQSCPEPTTWGGWGSWGSCSRTCQTGQRQRNRQCLNGNTCSGLASQTENCNADVVCQPDPDNGEWSSWTECSQTCGGGIRSRTRNCGLANSEGCSKEEQPCNRDECPTTEPELRGMEHKGCYFVPSYSNTIRVIEGETEDLTDNPFQREDPIRKCGTSALSLGYNAFALTLGYCISGSSDPINYQTQSGINICRDGKGGYIYGYFFMDVYVVNDVQSFSDSVFDILNPDPSPSPTPDPSGSLISSIPNILLLALSTLIVVLLSALV